MAWHYLPHTPCGATLATTSAARRRSDGRLQLSPGVTADATARRPRPGPRRPRRPSRPGPTGPPSRRLRPHGLAGWQTGRRTGVLDCSNATHTGGALAHCTERGGGPVLPALARVTPSPGLLASPRREATSINARRGDKEEAIPGRQWIPRCSPHTPYCALRPPEMERWSQVGERGAGCGVRVQTEAAVAAVLRGALGL